MTKASAETRPGLALAELRWMFRELGSRDWLPARVPGCVHRDLWRAGRIPDPFHGNNELSLRWIEARDWEYRATFSVPAASWREERIELVADGLDTIATVLLNGTIVGRSENMFQGHHWEVRRRLRRGPNELRLVFSSALRQVQTRRLAHRPPEFNDPVGGASRIRKQQTQFGWDWAPRFVTAGIWRDLRLEAWTGNRLAHVRVMQRHEDGQVHLAFTPEFAGSPQNRITGEIVLRHDGRVVAQRTGGPGRTAVTLQAPQLWWPNGQGAQPLYEAEFVARGHDGRALGRWQRRLGLRTLALERQPDQWGESFRFVVNGRPLFIKGANWVPAHAFVAGLTRADYERDVRAAAAVNMNLLRVWGGGIYESEDFYDLCDENGLLVWQDFMFACTLPPGDAAFLRSVATEAEQQVKRLRHRACLALWCGNNEIPLLNPVELRVPATRARYRALFHRCLPRIVRQHDGATSYWPSSEWRGRFENGHALGEKRGDSHFWEVWHARQPVKAYERWAFRFVSEFGMQSYCSPETQATFCPADDANLLGPTMELHQKNRGGNQTILEYVSRRYRLPKSQDDLIYLSQLNQAYCMQVGVEHYRRLTPRCMGAIYWQLNDCWPVASWSSIEFTGRWKALHYLARRFFAPSLVSAHLPEDESATIGNYRHSELRDVHLHTIHDAPAAARGTLRWELRHLDGRILRTAARSVVLRPGESVRQVTVRLDRAFARHGRDHLYLRIALEVSGRPASEDTVFFSPPRFVPLRRGRTEVGIEVINRTQARLSFRSDVFQHRFCFELPGLPHEADDNYFELYPGQRRVVLVSFTRPVAKTRIADALRYRSLADTYDHGRPQLSPKTKTQKS